MFIMMMTCVFRWLTSPCQTRFSTTFTEWGGRPGRAREAGNYPTTQSPHPQPTSHPPHPHVPDPSCVSQVSDPGGGEGAPPTPNPQPPHPRTPPLPCVTGQWPWQGRSASYPQPPPMYPTPPVCHRSVTLAGEKECLLPPTLHPRTPPLPCVTGQWPWQGRRSASYPQPPTHVPHPSRVSQVSDPGRGEGTQAAEGSGEEGEESGQESRCASRWVLHEVCGATGRRDELTVKSWRCNCKYSQIIRIIRIGVWYAVGERKI